MREEILKLIKSHPKHYGKMIRNNSAMMEWIDQNKKLQTKDFSMTVYSALYEVNNICEYGNIKKFHGINQGFRNCGTAKNCLCTKNDVSVSVKKSKELITEEQQTIINEKRKQTNIDKYGVENIGQTDFAKQRHLEYYLDGEKVSESNKKFRESMIAVYGVDNPQKVKSIKERSRTTLESKYGVSNAWLIPEIRNKSTTIFAQKKNSGDFLKLGYQRFTEYIKTNFNMELMTPFEDYKGIQQKDAYEYQFKCILCNNILSKKFYHSRGINCDSCNKKQSTFTSNEEQEIFDYITHELGIKNAHQSNRTIINPYELDMIFSDQKIAIEYGGLYWHSEISSGKHKMYHKTKMDLATEVGWRLITIFSDEWNTKREIVKSRLRHIFGKNIERYYARKLKIVPLTFNESKEFFNNHHIQGDAVAKWRYGLKTDDDNIVAAMTFAGGRKALNSKDQFELIRYSTNGCSVVGGADKLLKHFIKIHNPKTIVTYADLRWSVGNLYETLKFTKIGTPSPGYWYVENYSKRHHRYNYIKSKLVSMGFDVSKTEWEIMTECGYDRIWDCGHQKYHLTL